MRHLVLSIVCLAGLTAALAPPADAQGRRRPQAGGGGAGRDFPPAYRRLSKAQIQQLLTFCDAATAWIGETPAAPQLWPFFGRISPDPDRQADDPPGQPPAPGDELEREARFGILILATLNAEQVRQLVATVRKQAAAVAELRRQLLGLHKELATLRGVERPPKNQEREVRELGKPIGERQTQLALERVRSFVELREQLSEAQREYLQLLRQNLDQTRFDTAAVAKIREGLDKLSELEREAIIEIAVQAGIFWTGSGRDPESMGSRENAAALLESLNPVQQAQVLGILTLLQSGQADYLNKRLQVIAMFDGLRSGKPLDERKLGVLATGWGESLARLQWQQAQLLEKFRVSLSPAQAHFINQNIAQKP